MGMYSTTQVYMVDCNHGHVHGPVLCENAFGSMGDCPSSYLIATTEV